MSYTYESVDNDNLSSVRRENQKSQNSEGRHMSLQNQNY